MAGKVGMQLSRLEALADLLNLEVVARGPAKSGKGKQKAR